MTDCTIRTATSGDVETLSHFNCALASETEALELDQSTVQKGVKNLIENSTRGFYVVAEKRGTVAGSLMITREWSDWRNGEFWWIQSVYVSPEYRRQGIYRALYAHVKEKAQKERDVCGVRLYVEVENSRAQKTYQSLGMSITSYFLYEEMLRK